MTVELRDQLERAFRRLTAEQRAVLVMHHYVGFSGAEIADALGPSPGTVRSRLALRPPGNARGARSRCAANRRWRLA